VSEGVKETARILNLAAYLELRGDEGASLDAAP
jgi:hypothetical protein